MTHSDITLEFKQINYNVNVKRPKEEKGAEEDKAEDKNSKKGKTIEKRILKEISGSVRSGQVLAILGSSGAGKSSLLNVLSGRIPSNVKANGEVLINGRKMSRSDFNKVASYVQQHDDLYSFQTVKETIMFSSKLRNPKGTTNKECEEKTEDVIRQLGLSKCKDTIIGNDLKRGVSGGERKRVSIGVEVVRDTQIMLLDEPTTGLDSFMAYNVIENLKDLALRMNKIVIFTIHQPRSNIFELFDQIMLLSMGRTVYFGDAKNSINYFSGLGFKCPPHFNFTDFILNIISIDYRSVKATEESEKRLQILTTEWEKQEKSITFEAKEDIDEHPNTLSSLKKTKNRKSNTFSQFPSLMKRELKELLRNKVMLISALFPPILTALLIGAAFYQLPKDNTGYEDRRGAIFFLILTETMAPLFETLNLFSLAKGIFITEYQNGYYSSITFYTVNYLIFMILHPIKSLIFISISYWMIGLRDSVSSFFILYLCLLLTKGCSIALGCMIASMFKDLNKGKIFTPLIIGIMTMVAGFYIKLENLPKYLYYLNFILFLRYSYEIGIRNEMDGVIFPSPPANAAAAALFKESPLKNGTTIISESYPDRLHIALLFFILFASAMVYNIIGVLFLRRSPPKYSVLSGKNKK